MENNQLTVIKTSQFSLCNRYLEVSRFEAEHSWVRKMIGSQDEAASEKVVDDQTWLMLVRSSSLRILLAPDSLLTDRQLPAYVLHTKEPIVKLPITPEVPKQLEYPFVHSSPQAQAHGETPVLSRSLRGSGVAQHVNSPPTT